MACLDCFRGVIHEGQPRGHVIKLHGLPTYVTEPLDADFVKGIIVVIPDGFGWEFPNNRILADHYADKGGYKVYLPDFMNGNVTPVSALTNTQNALASSNVFYKLYYSVVAALESIPFMVYNRAGTASPVINKFFQRLRNEEGQTLPIGAAGFCWGGKHAVLLAHGQKTGDKPLIDAAFTGHPSWLDMPNDIHRIKIPVSFAIGDRDPLVPIEVAEKIKSMVERKPQYARGEVKIYDNASHGFCVRADIKTVDVAKQACEAEDQCISWFNAHLLSSNSIPSVEL